MKKLVNILLVLLFLASPVFAKKKSGDGAAITNDVVYSAKDSVVMVGTKTAELYGDAKVTYGGIELTAAFIRLRLDSSTVYATGVTDSTGAMSGKPKFKEGSEEYEATEMRYNFKSRKGMIKGTVSKQGEGFITASQTKKVDEDVYCLKNGKYTTCDQHDHPHFYLALTKAKMKQGKYIVSGPAYMVVEDVPLPLALPFGYFPINQKYSSGLLMPTLGDEASRGFFAKGLGYYFAINDYLDLAVTTDIYTKGSWSITASSTYKWRYRFSGSFNISFLQNVTGEPNTKDYMRSNDFRLLWSHTQDPKMSPYTQFSASVNFSTSSYEKNNIDSYYNPALISQNTKNSTVSVIQTFPNAPLTLTISASVSQRTSDSTINLNLPQVTLSMSRVFPFKRKKPVGKEKWYEKIGVSYSFNMTNGVVCKEKNFAHTNFLRDWNNGMKHEVPISASFVIAKYLNLNINLNNTLKWYFRRVDQRWEGDAAGSVVADTTFGFYNIYQMSASVGLQTQLFGCFTPKVKKGRNAPVFRHKIVPTVSFSVSPDYGADMWKYWGSYERPVAGGGTSTVYYDRYAGGVYGGSPSRGATGAVTFSVANNLEMKYWSRKDTTGKAKKITIIDNFSFGSGYNFVADSLNWSNITMNLRLKFLSKFSMNIDFVFDPYTYQLNEYGSVTRVNVSQLKKNHVLGRLMSTGTSFGYTFNNDTFKKKKDKEEEKKNAGTDKDEKKQETSELMEDIASVDPLSTPTERQLKRERWKKADADYQKFKIPWSLNLNYSIRYAYSTFNYDIMEYDRKLTHNLSISGSIDFTKTWHFSISTYYDITNNKWSYMNCTISKDLHCWQMSCSFVPIGTYTTYNFMIGVKSTLLQDLKYTKQSDTSERINWY